MRSFKFILFYLLFNIDVHVKAEDQYPLNCWAKTTPCTLQAGRSEQKLEIDKNQIVLTSGSVVQEKSHRKFSLLRGQLDIMTSKNDDFEMDLPNGTLRVTKASKARLSRGEQGFLVQVVQGFVELTPLGTEETLKVPENFKMRWDWIHQNFEVPVSIPMALTSSEWSSLYRRFVNLGGQRPNSKAIQMDIEQWRGDVDLGADLIQQTAERRIAEAKEIRNQKAEAKQALENENQKLRDLFRKKNHFN